VKSRHASGAVPHREGGTQAAIEWLGVNVSA
jgi:hypothetical protein